MTKENKYDTACIDDPQNPRIALRTKQMKPFSNGYSVILQKFESPFGSRSEAPVPPVPRFGSSECVTGIEHFTACTEYNSRKRKLAKCSKRSVIRSSSGLFPTSKDFCGVNAVRQFNGFIKVSLAVTVS
jgi:hypothetical protein